MHQLITYSHLNSVLYSKHNFCTYPIIAIIFTLYIRLFFNNIIFNHFFQVFLSNTSKRHLNVFYKNKTISYQVRIVWQERTQSANKHTNMRNIILCLQRWIDMIVNICLCGATKKCTWYLRAFQKRKARHINVHFQVVPP